MKQRTLKQIFIAASAACPMVLHMFKVFGFRYLDHLFQANRKALGMVVAVIDTQVLRCSDSQQTMQHSFPVSALSESFTRFLQGCRSNSLLILWYLDLDLAIKSIPIKGWNSSNMFESSQCSPLLLLASASLRWAMWKRLLGHWDARTLKGTERHWNMNRLTWMRLVAYQRATLLKLEVETPQA